MKYQAGFKFMDINSDYEVMEFMPKFNMYRLNNLTDNRQDELMQESEIDEYVNNIENIEARRENNRLFELKQEEIRRKEREKEEKEKAEYEFCYGFVDKSTPMQKGKILKALNKKSWYTDNGKTIGYMTRKEFIYNSLLQNAIPKFITGIQYYDKKSDKFKFKNEYRLYTGENEFYTITKTEYDYARYLLGNGYVA